MLRHYGVGANTKKTTLVTLCFVGLALFVIAAAIAARGSSPLVNDGVTPGAKPAVAKVKTSAARTGATSSKASGSNASSLKAAAPAKSGRGAAAHASSSSSTSASSSSASSASSASTVAASDEDQADDAASDDSASSGLVGDDSGRIAARAARGSGGRSALTYGYIKGKKFHDLNGNGARDSGEPYLQYWTIKAYKDTDGDGIKDSGETTVSDSDSTDSNGYYSLTLLAGKYVVCESQQSGWTQTYPANTKCGSGGGWALTVTVGNKHEGKDFGNFKKGKVSGKKFHDKDADGNKDSSEPYLSGWTINAYVDANGNGVKDAAETTVAASDVTDSNGAYDLNLNPGKYIVCEVQQSGWTQSYPSNSICGPGAGGYAVTITSGSMQSLRSGDRQVFTGTTSSSKDFGNYKKTGKTGKKFHDLNADGDRDSGEPLLAGWTINAYVDTNGDGDKDAGETTIAGSAVTDSGGSFTINLNPGKYILCEVQQSGWTQSAPSNSVCGSGIGGYAVTISGSGASSLRSGGRSVFTGTTSYDFGNYRNATKSGMKFHDLDGDGVKDAGEPGLGGWTITAYKDTDGDGIKDAGETTVGASAVTDANGNYSMSLKPGKYIVCETQQSGWTQTYPANNICAPGGGWAINLASGENDTGNDFGNRRPVDANIQISPLTATNKVGDPHVFTGHVNVNDGSGFVNAPAGTTINFNIVTGPGTLTPTSCTTIGTTGSCTVTLNSATPGVTTVRAATTVVVGGQTLNRATGDGLAGDSANAVKTWVDANIQISPLTATNEIGDPHVFTGHVNINTGTGGYVNAPAGTTINFNVVSGPGTLTPTSCLTIGTTGSCTVTLNNTTPGVTTVRASTAVVVGGQTLNRATGDGLAGDSANAVKNWVDANIQISPLQATNTLGDPHVFTGHVNVNTGTGGYVNAPAGTTISFNIVSGPGTLSAPSCTTIAATGSCSVTLTNSTTVGQTTVRASTAVVVGGETLNRATGDAHAGDSANAVKTWVNVDANIQISPLTATNEIGDPHVFTGHVNVNPGTGFVNAPAGTTINFNVVSGPGTLTPTSCTTIGTTGSCTVTLNSATPGVTTVRASTSVVVGGQTLNRATGDGLAGDSANAVKNWVDANIQIAPLTDTNALGDPHVFTGHVNVNPGSGFANAPAGTTINFTIVSGPGTLSAPSCTTIGTTGSCTVTLNNPSTTGSTTVRASTAVVVGGLTLNRATGDANAGDSANAVKTWVDANIQISPLQATNTVGDPHVLTGHVNVNPGTGFVNAPAGTTINFSILSGPGSLSAPSCTTIGTTGSCTVTLSNTTGVGQTTIRAATAVVVGGLTLNRATGDGLPGDSADAVKTWVQGFSGTKYHDLNANGLKDAGEPGLPGWTIRAYSDPNGNGTLDAGETTISGSAVTGAGGVYSIPGLGQGSYVLCEVLQANWFQSAPANTKCAAIAGLGAGGHAVILGAGGGPTTDLDFGNWTKAIKSGMKWEDIDNDGVKDANEPGLAGWVIRAYADTNGDGVLQAGETTIAASATTGTGGAYSLSLNPGKYVVCEVMQGGFDHQSYPANTKCVAIVGLGPGGWAISLVSGQTEANNDFGNVRVPFKPPVVCRSLKLNRNQAFIGRTVTVKATCRDQHGKGMKREKVIVVGAGVKQHSARTNANGVVTFRIKPTKVGIIRFRVFKSTRCTARITVRGPFRPPLTGRDE